MWRKRNPCTLLVGMQTGAAAVENSMEVPQTIKSRIPYDPAIPLLGTYLKKMKTLSRRYTYPYVHHSSNYDSQDTEAT